MARRSRLPRRALRLRPLTREDGPTLDAVFAGMSETSRALRFLAPVRELSTYLRDALLDLDDSRHVALVAELHHRGTVTPIGIARYALDEVGDAEVAYEVVDAWQGHGVGRTLVEAIVRAARTAGIRRIRASVLRENEASLAVLRRALPQLRTDSSGEVIEVSAWLVEPPLTAADLLAEMDAA
jgi:RimJ/RimL family protein N-acetyltransferase